MLAESENYCRNFQGDYHGGLYCCTTTDCDNSDSIYRCNDAIPVCENREFSLLLKLEFWRLCFFFVAYLLKHSLLTPALEQFFQNLQKALKIIF